jgi:hypothetical protein
MTLKADDGDSLLRLHKAMDVLVKSTPVKHGEP